MFLVSTRHGGCPYARRIQKKKATIGPYLIVLEYPSTGSADEDGIMVGMMSFCWDTDGTPHTNVTPKCLFSANVCRRATAVRWPSFGSGDQLHWHSYLLLIGENGTLLGISVHKTKGCE